VAAVSAKHIEIVRSTKPWLNSLTRLSSEAILAVLSRSYAKVGVSIVNDLSDLESLIARQPDLVFLGMKFVPVDPALGRYSPNIWLADYLDEHYINYTGSSRAAHELELNKHLDKQQVLEADLNTSPFLVIRQSQRLTQTDVSLNFPLFIKPTNRGGGLGIGSDSVVNNFYELEAKVRSIAVNLKSDALVEEYLPGREFSVAILKHETSKGFAVMPIELIAPPDDQGHRLLSEEVKTANSEQAVKVVDDIIKYRVTALALGVFKALGARDYGRIDIRFDKNGVANFLEANLIPSLISGYGSFPKSCVLNINLEYEQMILHIVRLGLARQPIISADILKPSRLDALPAFEAIFS